MNPYLRRCLELARMGGNAVAPNPRVGAVVVHADRIIGEGYHRLAGTAHAEVNAINSVRDKELLSASTLYVSLEPCNHHGKTPPCTDLILLHNISKVVIGALDPNPQMAGKSVRMLREKGIEVTVAEDDSEFVRLNRHFCVNQAEGRPFVTLKWAESKDGFIAARDANGVLKTAQISHPQVGRFVHRLRAEHQAILVGKNTVQIDDPALTTRRWPGADPTRIILDRNLDLPLAHRVFGAGRVIVVNGQKDEMRGHIRYFRPKGPLGDIKGWLRDLYRELQIGSILVEGGYNVLEQFLGQAAWDEIYRNIGAIELKNGLKAPELPKKISENSHVAIDNDLLMHYLGAG